MAKKEKLLEKAQKFIQKGYLEKAIVEYKNVAAMDPSDISVRLRIGDLYVKTGQKEEAVKEYMDVAKVNTRKGFYLKAIAVYKQVVKLDNSVMDIHYKLADLYTKQRLIADAISEYSFIVTNFEKKGKTTDALELLKKMAEVDPENVGVKLKLADLHQKLGFDKDSLEEYSWVFDRFVSQGKLDKAEKIFLEVYKNHPEEPKVLEGLSELYKKNSDNEKFAEYGSKLAAILKDSGEIEKAKALCEAIVEVQPDSDQARSVLGGLEGKAVELPVELLREEPTPPETVKEAEAGEKPEEVATPGEEPLISWDEVSEEVAEDVEAEEPTAGAELKGEAPEEAVPEVAQKGEEGEGEEGEEGEEEFVEVEVPFEEEKGPEEVLEEAPVEEIAEKAPSEEVLEELPVEEIAEEAPSEEVLEEAPVEEVVEETPVEEVVEVTPVEEVLEELPVEEIADEAPVEEVVEKVTERTIEQFDEIEEISPEELSEEFHEEEKTPGARVEREEEAHEEDYVDLSRELGLEEALDSVVHPWEEGTSGEAVSEFKGSLGKQLSKEDTETHHNLGIAYMEMELYDDAVREFKIALKDPAFELDSYTRLGLCAMFMKNADAATDYYLKALKVKGTKDEERKGLMYELGLAYEAGGKNLEAGEMFRSVYQMDHRHRDVVGKVKDYEEVRPSIPLDDSMIEVEILL